MQGFLEWYRGKRVVVSGASGYVAAALIRPLSAVAARVTRLSRRPLPPLICAAEIRDCIGDPADSALWEQALPQADVVFHLAAQTSFYTAAKDPRADFHANVAPMQALLEAQRSRSRRAFIVFAGSSTQAGLPKARAVNESHPDEPTTIYDLHKLLAEEYLEAYCRQSLAIGATLRLSNVFGPGPESSSADRGILNAMILRALKGQPLTVFGEGKAVRDYLYIDDVAEAFLAVGRGGPEVLGRHFVLGSGRGISLVDAFRLVAERVAARTGRGVPVESVPSPRELLPIESRNFTADTTALRAATGWAHKVSLEEGIDRTIDYFSSHSPFEAVINP